MSDYSKGEQIFGWTLVALVIVTGLCASAVLVTVTFRFVVGG